MSNLIKVTREELDNLIKSKSNIRDIDVSYITDMGNLFSNVNFNDWKDQSLCDITNWNVGNVRNMSRMFYNAKTFNQPIKGWNVGNVKDMSWMFYNAKTFNQPIEGWNVSNVKDMSGMFDYAETFNQPISWLIESGNQRLNYGVNQQFNNPTMNAFQKFQWKSQYQ